MTRRGRLCSAMSHLIWGYVFLHVDITLLTVNILPNWVGYLLLKRGIDRLEEEESTAQLLKVPAKLLLAWELIVWLGACVGIQFQVPVAEALFSALGLYFHFQLLTNVVETVARCGYADHTAILRWRNVRTVVLTVMAFEYVWENWVWITVVMVVVYLIVMLCLCLKLKDAKNYLEDAPEEVFGV